MTIYLGFAILDCFERMGLELREEIEAYFQGFNI